MGSGWLSYDLNPQATPASFWRCPRDLIWGAYPKLIVELIIPELSFHFFFRGKMLFFDLHDLKFCWT